MKMSIRNAFVWMMGIIGLLTSFSHLASAAEAGRIHFTIGGIGMGAEMNYVLQVYGEPTDIYSVDGTHWPHEPKNIVYSYKDKFIVRGIPNQEGQNLVLGVSVREPGLKTEHGFSVGQPIEQVIRVLGMPAPPQVNGVLEGRVQQKKVNWRPVTVYTYEVIGGDNYETMSFVVNKEGIIQEITLGFPVID